MYVDSNSSFSQERFFTPQNPLIKKIKVIAKYTFAGILGCTTSTISTLPDLNKASNSLSNIGVITAFGALNTWGITMFQKEVSHILSSDYGKNTPCGIAQKVLLVSISILFGWAAQMPFGDAIAPFEEELWKRVMTFGSMWVRSYVILNCLTKTVETLKYSPRMTCNIRSKKRLQLIKNLENCFKNAFYNSTLHSTEPEALFFYQWEESACDSSQERQEGLISDMTSMSHIHAKHKVVPSSLSRFFKRSLQITAISAVSLYILQDYLVAKDYFSQHITSPFTEKLFTIFSAAVLSPQLLKSSWEGPEHLTNLCLDLCKTRRIKTLPEKHFPKLSKSLYFLGLLITFLPIKHISEMSHINYPLSSKFGKLFLGCRITTNTFFVYFAIQEIVNTIIKDFAKTGFFSPAFQKDLLLEEDVNRSLLQLREKNETELNSLALKFDDIELSRKLTQGFINPSCV